MKRMAVLTSGGDAPGMNPCVRAVVRTAVYHKLEIVGIDDGFDGLLRGEMRPLSARDVGGVLQRGGTFLQTARCPEFRERKGRLRGLRELNERGIEGLVVIGGDGSMRGTHALCEMGFAAVGVPASIDNDIWGTDMSLGVDTALNTIMEAIDKLRDTASSHQRAFLVETMGRSCGYLALLSGIVSGAEFIIIPEQEVTLEEVRLEIEDAYARGKAHAFIIVAEGAPIEVHQLAAYLEDQDVGFETRVTVLGHVPRGGSPTAFDRILATRMGVKAAMALMAGEKDTMVGLSGRDVVTVPLVEVTAQTRSPSREYVDMARMLAR
jgi:6-phosphofructokinase 1